MKLDAGRLNGAASVKQRGDKSCDPEVLGEKDALSCGLLLKLRWRLLILFVVQRANTQVTAVQDVVVGR